jgi:sugar/nucleoside kinase (ribokinase family)
VQTEGRNGCYTTSRDQQFHTPAFEVEVVDTTGAGDVFHGAYLVGLAKQWELQRTAAFASAVAALHCTVLGNRNGIPSMAEAEALIEARGAAVQT